MIRPSAASGPQAIKVLSGTWAGVEVTWGAGERVSRDLQLIPHGLNVSFEAQTESRSRVGDGPTLLRALPVGAAILTNGEDCSWVENPARFSGLNLSLEPNILKAYAVRNGWAMPPLRSTAFEVDMRLHDIARLIIDELALGSGGRLYQDALINLAMAHIAQAYGLRTPKIEQGRLDERRLLTVRDYIEEHLADPLPLDELAEVAGLSTFHFARAFKLTTGHPPHKYVVHRRIERARRLLIEGNLPLAEVAFRVGYTSVSHFIKQFRIVLGLSPGDVRRARD